MANPIRAIVSTGPEVAVLAAEEVAVFVDAVEETFAVVSLLPPSSLPLSPTVGSSSGRVGRAGGLSLARAGEATRKKQAVSVNMIFFFIFSLFLFSICFI